LVGWKEKKALSKVPEQQGAIRQKVDNFFTDYLRNTTSDQEILDFYGEGNIIGRKGINTNTVVDDAFNANKLPGNRPTVKRVIPQSNELFGLPGEQESIVNINKAVDPRTGNPWQMKFETLPFPTEGTATSSATRFLKDFRVPTGTAIDYGFETAPNVKDVNAIDSKELLNDPRNYQNARAAYLAEDAGTPLSESGALRDYAKEQLEGIEKRSSAVTRPGGQIVTPTHWSSRGFKLPENLKQETLNTFKEQILQAEKPFGSVSQLTPVREDFRTLRPGGDVDWRANLYEKAGLAGPMTEVHVAGAYGGSSGNVQMFTKGKERLLPIQPYTEFYGGSTASKPSVLGTAPAPDFTPFQKTVGTRNYLIGKNILEGRGNLGAGFRSAVSVGAADLVPSREAVQDFYEGKPLQGFGRMAGDFAGGIPTALATGAAVAAAPALAPFVPGIAAGLTTIRIANAADEASRRQTGEGLISKFRQTLGTAPRTGYANPDFKTTTQTTTTPQVTALSPQQRKTMKQRQNRNELEKRVDLFKERFNPSRGEFGFSELILGR